MCRLKRPEERHLRSPRHGVHRNRQVPVGTALLKAELKRARTAVERGDAIYHATEIQWTSDTTPTDIPRPGKRAVSPDCLGQREINNV